VDEKEVKKITIARPIAPASNGDGQPPGTLQGRKQVGVDQVFMPRVSPEVLRAMDHAEWLESFAKVMQMQTGVEMTPMRAGVISRCNLAAEFIRMLKVENNANAQKLTEANAEITRLRKRKPKDA
jgi:hypothetical protein